MKRVSGDGVEPPFHQISLWWLPGEVPAQLPPALTGRRLQIQN